MKSALHDHFNNRNKYSIYDLKFTPTFKIPEGAYLDIKFPDNFKILVPTKVQLAG